MNLNDIMRRNAKRYPDKTAFVFEKTRYTFKELNDRANRVANALLGMGVRKGDRVAALLDNCSQYVELICGLPKGGIILVPLNTRLSERELTYIINEVEATTLFLGENYLDLVNSLKGELKGVRNFIVVGEQAEMMGYKELIPSSPPDEPKVDIEEEDIAYIYITSGTTGLPKGVIISHRNVLEGNLNAILTKNLTHKDINLTALPFFWSWTVEGISWACFYRGCTLALQKEFSPQAVLEAIEKEKITVYYGTTHHISLLLECPDLDKYDLSSLRYIEFGGAPMPVGTWKRAIRVFGNIFIQCYGLTEANGPVYLLPEDIVTEGPPEKVRRLQSCGKESINVEARVVDEEGKDVSPGEVGELLIKGDCVMKGYWKLPEVTAEALRGGYLYTGDLATVDEEGYIYIVGRKKEVITSGGKSIYPTEVEEVLYHHPSILEAAVVGVPDPELGEAVKAVVALRDGKEISQEELIGFCRQNLADYAVPRSIDFINKLPRTSTGKVMRKILKEKYK